MAMLKLLDGAYGYLRWKELVLLHLHSIDVAHVLSDEPPPAPKGSRQGQSAKKWARDDAVCRGHILAALSDHLLPVYVRHATSRALWQALARTYEPDASSWQLRLEELEFGEHETPRERVARVEALTIAGFPECPDDTVTFSVRWQLPDLAADAITHSGMGTTLTMDGVWKSAAAMEKLRNRMQISASRKKKGQEQRRAHCEEAQLIKGSRHG